MAFPSSSRGPANCSLVAVTDGLARLARSLARGLRRELHLTPKPGLVDREDCGSHPDLSLEVMERSIDLLAGFYERVSCSLSEGEPTGAQIQLARQAEQSMKSVLGTNTHKGAIFLGGLALIAQHRTQDDGEAPFRAALASAAGEVALHGAPKSTNGDAARRRFRVGGILQEVAAGLPSVFEGALPVFHAARHSGADGARATFAMLAQLMRTVEDTTALHRCGAEGLDQLRRDGAELARLLEGDDGAHLVFLRERNLLYRRMNLTMGGVADLLGIALGWLDFRGELPDSLA